MQNSLLIMHREEALKLGQSLILTFEFYILEVFKFY